VQAGQNRNEFAGVQKEMNSSPQVSTSPPTEKRDATRASAEGMCREQLIPGVV
jgi:hypothetical protein